MQRVSRIVQHLQPGAACPVPSSLRAADCSSSAEGPSGAFFARHVRVAPEVATALREGRAVVALESTIISHGMPWPANYETALRVEQTARDAGAVPATIAILSGTIHIGLERAQLEELARLGTKCAKVSRRDLAFVVSRRAHGATTVAATMLLASWAGIRLFATGGIGGVHRGGESSMDVSADLTELGRTPVAVVCAGVKSILDIPRTLEVLETQGVSVAVWQSDEFPAFFTPTSGCKAPSRVDDALQAASMVHTAGQLGIRSGQLFAVPIPSAAAARAEPTERATQQALREASERHIAGRDITPYLLGRIAELTKGESLASNIELVLNNVRVGSLIAVEIARLQREGKAASSATAAATAAPSASPAASPSSSRWPSSFGSSPLVIGGANLDLLGRPALGTKFLLGTSNPGTLARSYGGVGRNMAEVLGRLGAQPWLLTAVGDDGDGRNLLEHARGAGVRVEAAHVSTRRNGTSTYMAIFDEKGDLFTTIADMAVVDELDAEALPNLLPSPATLATAPLILLDGNISQKLLEAVCARASAAGVPVVFEPTSIEKCVRGVGALLANQITYVTPSAAELLAISQGVEAEVRAQTQGQKHDTSFLGVLRDRFEHNHATEGVEAQARGILAAVASRAAQQGRAVRPVHILLKRGERGAMIASLLPAALSAGAANASAVEGGAVVVLTHLPAGRLPSPLVNTSGAGDTLVGASAWWLLRCGRAAARGEDLAALRRAVQYGMRAAEQTLVAEQSVSPLLSAQLLLERQEQFDREQQANELARERAHVAQR